jgi:hypothetical protein
MALAVLRKPVDGTPPETAVAAYPEAHDGRDGKGLDDVVAREIRLCEERENPCPTSPAPRPGRRRSRRSGPAGR